MIRSPASTAVALNCEAGLSIYRSAQQAAAGHVSRRISFMFFSSADDVSQILANLRSSVANGTDDRLAGVVRCRSRECLHAISVR